MAERFANHRGSHAHGLGHHAHAHAASGMSRRQFVTMAMAGAGIAGAGVIGLSGQAAAKSGPARGIPRQLPSFSPILKAVFGIEIPLILPFEIDPFINPGPIGDPMTFDDFTGTMGMVEAEGVSENNSEGVPRTWAVDARFWEGRYIDRSGHIRNGAFAFLWLDVMEDPSLGPFDPNQVQIHDFNPADLNDPGQPDYFMDGGLFWTGAMPRQGAKMRGNGRAEMHLSDYELSDFVNAPNAILRPPGFPRDPAVANVDVHWTPTGATKEISAARLSGQGSFAGTYYQTDVEFEWSAKNLATGYEFSTAESSLSVVTAQFSARVRNGVFV